MKGRPTKITFKGRTMTLRQWASELGVTPRMLHGRLRNGWPLEQVLVPRMRQRDKRIEFNGDSLTVKEWSIKLGIPAFTLYGRLRKGLPFDKVFFQGQMKPGVSHLLTFNGITLNLTEWSERLGVPFNTLQGRVKRGFSVEKVLSVDRLTKEWSRHPKYKVIRKTKEKYHGCYMWEVECPFCGTTFKAQCRKLGKSVLSCGCLRYHDYTGETVNFLHVVKMVGVKLTPGDFPRFLYECVCTYKGCGIRCLVDAHLLANGKQSCGCKMIEDCKTRAINKYKEL